MIKKTIKWGFCFSLIWFASCKTTKDEMMVASMDYTLLDTLFVAAPRPIEKDTFSLPVYNESAKKRWVLVHTDLDLRFDWEKEIVLGSASITMHPQFYPTSEIRLDAVNFTVQNVMVDGRPANYKYDEEEIVISLDRIYSKENKVKVEVDYKAYPGYYNKNPNSKIVSGEKGLYFINATGSDPHKPQQIWTQGETTYNSRWFPTIDESNQRLSQRTRMTVSDTLKTLSNGYLESSILNKDGTRTDTWSQQLKHAPYLFMVAVGDYDVVTEKWKGKDLIYLVEQAYKEDAKTIFNHTGEMLSFFSDILDYPFPWDKYAQIVVRDFNAGAMENTSAVTFSEHVQKTTRALIDNPNDAIVAHELFHHWFGNIVTCESWANLTLNEGFANYSEYLWFEHKYGIDRADHHRLQELNGYLHSIDHGGTHPLIHYQYHDKEDMFDAHSYNKGGLVLHMLRHYVGDKAFFAALNKYLVDNQYSEVEADELRIAFEDVVGEDLNWFFNQWYFDDGHPELYVSYSSDNVAKTVTVTVEQTQNPDLFPPIFILPTDIAFYNKSGEVSYVPVTLKKRKQAFTFVVEDNFLLASFDGHKRLLAEIVEDRTNDDHYNILQSKDVNYFDKKEALLSIDQHSNLNLVLNKALNDPYYHIRKLALEKHSGLSTEVLKKIAKEDKHSAVRKIALRKLIAFSGFSDTDFLIKVIKTDPAYGPVEEALLGLNKLNPQNAFSLAQTLIEPRPSPLDDIILDLFCVNNRIGNLSFVLRQLETMESYQFYGKIEQLLDLFVNQEAPIILEVSRGYFDISVQRSLPKFHRLLAGQALFTLKNQLAKNSKSSNYYLSAKQLTDKLMETETDPELLAQYRLF